MNAGSMKIQNQQAKQAIIQRLKRIEGQVHGIETMLEEERDCKEIMQQLAAVRSAMQGVSRTFLQEYAAGCLQAMEQDPAEEEHQAHTRREKIIQDMIAFLDKAP